jgi:hypothetical protein
MMNDLLSVPALDWIAILVVGMLLAAGLGLIESRRRAKARQREDQ